MTASKKNSRALAGIAAVLNGATVEQALAISGVKPDKAAQAAADKAKMIASAKALTAAAPKSKAKPVPKPLPKEKDVSKVQGKKTRAATPAKPAEPKAPATPKAASVAFVARTVKAGAPVHVIAEGARPQLGRALYAHTHAALALLGLLDASRPAVPQKAVLTVMGQRAVSYHRKQMNFEDGPNHTLRLSISGRNAFMTRVASGRVDGEMANAFMELFVSGKAATITGVAEAKVYQTVLAS